MNKLEGKTALITGGTSGIGLATAKAFVNEGAYVFITGRREAELAAAVKEIGRNVTGIQGDVSNLGDLDRLFAQIKQEKGKLDIVFANAGVAKFAALGAITEELYDWTFDITLLVGRKNQDSLAPQSGINLRSDLGDSANALGPYRGWEDRPDAVHATDEQKVRRIDRRRFHRDEHILVTKSRFGNRVKFDDI